MATSKRVFAPLKSSTAGERAAHDQGQAADLATKREVAEGNVRAREAAKKEVAQRNEAAHKEAVTRLARRQRLRQDMRKGLEF